MRAGSWVVVSLLIGCGKVPPNTESGQVCCESFGYGAMMAKCCESYEWVAPDACTVPDGFVGGGKQVVEDGKCPAR